MLMNERKQPSKPGGECAKRATEDAGPVYAGKGEGEGRTRPTPKGVPPGQAE